jgi:hypothetical protein
MRTLALGVIVAGAGLAATLSYQSGRTETQTELAYTAATAAPATAPTHADVTPEELTAVVQRYCVVCHNDQLRTGNVSFQGIDIAQADQHAPIAERMIRKLRAGMMPPPGMPRPGGDTLLALVETLERVVDEAAAAQGPAIGVRRFQRLSQAEFKRVIKDLLALDIEPNRWLPPDVLVGSFDNVADGQRLSTTLLDAYLRAATDISRLAVGNAAAAPASIKYTNTIEVSQHAWEQVDGAPFGTRGGMVITHDFPVDGEYVFEVATLFGSGNQTYYEDLDISIDGEPVALILLPHNGEANVPLRTEPIFVRAGQRHVSAAFVRRIDGPYDDRFSPFDWSFVGGEDSQTWAGNGITALQHLNEIIVTGPHNPQGVSETASRAQVFSCRPKSEAEARPCAASIVERLAAQAYRRPVTGEDLAGLMELYDTGASEGGFEMGVRDALQGILASPSFVFRLELEPEGAVSSAGYRLSDVDLANRLSFMLWASGPDAELLKAATDGRLSNDAELERQVKRMLADPRSEALATRFAHQWLRLQDVLRVPPEPFLYPDYTQQLGKDMVRETELLFDYLVRQDHSLLELYNADYTFVNERLARHYGIPGVAGDDFRMVQYPDDLRRGILGHASVLKLTSMSARTSPVLRGKWVMQVLMGTPPPPPPPNVPVLDVSVPAAGKRLTTRERMEQHRKNPTCNACHRFMDPIGLSLDNYDVVGQWRIRENMAPLDTRGTFYDGTDISTPKELTTVLLKRPIPLVRTFTSSLMAYAIGRPVEYYDQPGIRRIVRNAEANGYTMSSFILGVVKSDPFRMRQTATTTAN